MEANQITEAIIGAAITVHRVLGPGLLESAYQACMVHELKLQGVQFEREQYLPIVYRGLKLDCRYRIDLIVESQVIVELKAVAKLEPVHSAQLLTYLKLTGYRFGLLINFNVPALKHGVRRLVHG